MNRALLYLWLALLKRRAQEFVRSLRRPTILVSFAAVLGLFYLLFHYRHYEFVGRLVKPASLRLWATLMIMGSLIRGFWQRGLVFEPPDIEFVFTSPFSQNQVVAYRLLPHYLYAVIQGIVAAAILAPHLSHPVLFAAGLTLFQVICFHLATAGSLLAGTLPEDVHHRLRCMVLAAGFLLLALYFRAAWDIRFVPDFALAPAAQLFFYPAVTLPDAVGSPALREWVLRLKPAESHWLRQLWVPACYLAALSLGAGLSLWALFRLKANVFEPSLATTSRAAERRQRLRQGRELRTTTTTETPSAGLPAFPLFRGVGAIVWKNFLIARRSRRQLLVAFLLTAFFTCGFAALLWKVNDAQHEGAAVSGISADSTLRHLMFHLGLAFWIGTLALFLQRVFPFDFRRDGNHLLDFRTLPVTPLKLVLAEVAVPVCCVLLCQGVCLVPLLFYARFEWPILLLLLLAYPAVALALNSVWNLHYLLSASRRSAGQSQAPSAVGTLMVVALSFLIFVPSIWTVRIVSHWVCERAGIVLPVEGAGGAADVDAWMRFVHIGVPITGAGAIAVQYFIDLLLLLALARLFRRAAVSHESS